MSDFGGNDVSECVGSGPRIWVGTCASGLRALGVAIGGWEMGRIRHWDRAEMQGRNVSIMELYMNGCTFDS